MYEYSQRGRRTGWAPDDNIQKDAAGFDDVDSFFGETLATSYEESQSGVIEEDSTDQSLASAQQSRRSSFGSEMDIDTPLSAPRRSSASSTASWNGRKSDDASARQLQFGDDNDESPTRSPAPRRSTTGRRKSVRWSMDQTPTSGGTPKTSTGSISKGSFLEVPSPDFGGGSSPVPPASPDEGAAPPPPSPPGLSPPGAAVDERSSAASGSGSAELEVSAGGVSEGEGEKEEEEDGGDPLSGVPSPPPMPAESAQQPPPPPSPPASTATATAAAASADSPSPDAAVEEEGEEAEAAARSRSARRGSEKHSPVNSGESGSDSGGGSDGDGDVAAGSGSDSDSSGGVPSPPARKTPKSTPKSRGKAKGKGRGKSSKAGPSSAKKKGAAGKQKPSKRKRKRAVSSPLPGGGDDSSGASEQKGGDSSDGMSFGGTDHSMTSPAATATPVTPQKHYIGGDVLPGLGFSSEGGSDGEEGSYSGAAMTPEQRAAKRRRRLSKIARLPRALRDANNVGHVATPQPGLRRSRRRRFPVQEAWRNERVTYGMEPDATLGEVVPCIIGVNPGTSPHMNRRPTSSARRAKRGPASKSRRGAGKRGGKSTTAKRRAVEEEEEEEVLLPEDVQFVGRPMAPALQLDGRTKKIAVRVERDDLTFQPLSLSDDGEDDDENEGASVAVTYDLPPCLAGLLTLKPGGNKAEEQTGACTQVFLVLHAQKGSLQVTIGGQPFLVNREGTFMVPANQTYSLVNHSSSVEARVGFFVMRPHDGPSSE